MHHCRNLGSKQTMVFLLTQATITGQFKKNCGSGENLWFDPFFDQTGRKGA